MTKQKDCPDCYECKFRGTIPGDCHSTCKNSDAKVTADAWGIRNGWFCHPWNFDPCWLESCTGFESKEAP
jgi:hypothetical protein